MKKPCVRFAPSPTGLLHLGNIRVALLNYLYSKSQKGKFILRFDDTDQKRSTMEYVEGIRRDLSWLGLQWEEEFFQTRRLERYSEVFERLKERGRVYACYETPEELEYKRNRQRLRGHPPVYDREGLRLTELQHQMYRKEGRRPHWRFLLEDKEVRWEDKIQGLCVYNLKNISDPIVKREDGTWLYLLPSVVDDVDMKVTNVIRGADHIVNAAAQIQMFHALEEESVDFSHASLMVMPDGALLSKRLGSMSLGDFIDEGYEPQSIYSFLAHLGTSLPLEGFLSLDELSKNFSLDFFGKSASLFLEKDLLQLNGKILRLMPFETIRPLLLGRGFQEGSLEEFWILIRENILQLKEAQLWKTIFFHDIVPSIGGVQDRAYIQEAYDCLPENWTSDVWSVWKKTLQERTARKGKNLVAPLRQVLTGQESGPDMSALLLFMGKEKAKNRLLSFCNAAVKNL